MRGKPVTGGGGCLEHVQEDERRQTVSVRERRNETQVLGLTAGEWVEVRDCEEILATLDDRGSLDRLPFMPEMLQYCGQRLQVAKRADKTCDNIQAWSIRRMKDAVHLDGVRCDGAAHGGCEAGCLIFWKEAWLKRVQEKLVPLQAVQPADAIPSGSRSLCTVERIHGMTQTTNQEGDKVYSCQATELRNFTSYMKIWDPRQYIRDLRSGNLVDRLANDSRGQRALELLLGMLRLLQALFITLFNEVQARRHGKTYPFIVGTLKKTQVEKLDLQPGELVQVRNKEEIIATLDTQNRNRGLLFDSEMLPYCGGIFRVLRRVHRIIDEKTGKMSNMKYPCIVLEGVVCKSTFHRLCPRAIYSYWRENWLRRVSPDYLPARSQCEREAESCQRQ